MNINSNVIKFLLQLWSWGWKENKKISSSYIMQMRKVSNSHSLAQNTCRKQKANVTFGEEDCGWCRKARSVA